MPRRLESLDTTEKDVMDSQRGEQCLCEKIKCPHFEWRRDPVYQDFDVGYMWCEKHDKEILDQEESFVRECSERQITPIR